MTAIIAFAGKKGSGKSTVCNFLLRNAPELFGAAKVNLFHFADALKETAVDILGLRPEQVWGTDAEKDTLTRYRWEDLPHYNAILADKVPGGNMTGREVLQQLGVGVFRQLNENVWVETALRRIKKAKTDIALIGDCRFPNEADLVREARGKIIRLTRAPTGDTHESETALDNWGKFDAVVNNAELSVNEANLEVVRLLREWRLAR